MRTAAVRKPNPDHKPAVWREPIKVQVMRASNGNIVPFARPASTKPTDSEGYAKAIRRQRGERLRDMYPDLWAALCYLPLAKAAIRKAETRERAVWELEAVERKLLEHAEDLICE